MPIYEYQCEFGHTHEEYQSIKEFDKDRIVECPQCGNKMESVINGGLGGFVENITTVGQLGEHNWKKLGKCRQEEMREKNKASRAAAAKEAGIDESLNYKKMRKLSGLTMEQKRRYVQTGKLPP